VNKDLRRLKRDIEKGSASQGQPFDRYAYNAFSWQAKHWMTYGKTQEERKEAARLHDLAVQKSRELA
jgi:hypothetical protein